MEEVLSFDAVEEYGLPDMDELVSYYETTYRNGQKANPEQVFPGGYYKTIVSGAIQTFGWDMLLLAAAERKRFDLSTIIVLGQKPRSRVTAKRLAEAIRSHGHKDVTYIDDMVWSAGPFMKPDFYRASIFPRYRELWQVLHDAGKIVLYCSDGTWTEFVDDIASAGADGFIFEPTTSLDYVVERYGKTHVIVGSKVDCRTLTFGTREQIKSEIDDTLVLAKDCPGFMFAVGNHIPSNVSVFASTGHRTAPI